MFQQGTALKALKTVSLYENMVYDEGGNTVISEGNIFGTIKAGEQIGIVEATFAQQNFVYVQLFKPVTKNLKKRYYALIFTDNIQALPAKSASSGTIEYFAKCEPTSSVNVRLSASLAGTIKTKLKNGSLIGETDGKVGNNGFLKFNLALGGVGFVHKDYVTKTKITATIDKSSEKITVTNPQTGKDEEKTRTTVTTNEGWELKDLIKPVGIGLIIWGITKVLSKIFKF